MTRTAIFALASLLASGCSLTADTFSCAVKFDGAPDKCVDYSEVSFQIRTGIEGLCRGLRGNFSTTSACPTENRVGGCRRKDKSHVEVDWYYSTGAIPQTAQDVMKRCASGEMFLNPDGTVGSTTAPADMSVAPDMSAPKDLSVAPDLLVAPDQAGGLPAPAAGRSILRATFSSSMNGYNGLTTALEGMGSGQNNEATSTGTSLRFRDRNAANDRLLTVNIGSNAPVAGMTYAADAQNPILYNEGTLIDTASLKYWACTGSVTVDKVSGTTYWFSFTGACAKNASVATNNNAAGSVTVTGVGAGTL